MPSPDLGTKRQCPSCAARFYDLNKKPITCPKCAFSFEPEALLKPRRSRPGERAEEARPVVVVEAPVAAAEAEEAVDEEAVAEAGAVEDAEEDEAAVVEEGAVVEPEAVVEEDGDEAAAPAPTKRRGTTEEVDPDLVEVDENEELDDDGDEDDDTLIEPDEDEDEELDININKEEEDR